LRQNCPEPPAIAGSGEGQISPKKNFFEKVWSLL